MSKHPEKSRHVEAFPPPMQMQYKHLHLQAWYLQRGKKHLLATRNGYISMHFMYAIGFRYRTCLKSFIALRLDTTVLGKCQKLHVFQSHLDGNTLAPFSLKFSSNPIGLLEWEPRLLPTWNFPASVSHIGFLTSTYINWLHWLWTSLRLDWPMSHLSPICCICQGTRWVWLHHIQVHLHHGHLTFHNIPISSGLLNFSLLLQRGYVYGVYGMSGPLLFVGEPFWMVIVWPWNLQFAQQQLASIATYLLQRSLDLPNFQCKPQLNLFFKNHQICWNILVAFMLLHQFHDNDMIKLQWSCLSLVLEIVSIGCWSLLIYLAT